MKISGSLIMVACLFASTAAFAQSNIDGTDKYAWGENVGWVNFRPSEADGVVVDGDVLSGYAWMENAGWLHFGDGTPEGGSQYSNTSATDYGVNSDGAGNLSGYAWGENIGWVCFDTSGSGGSQVTIDGSGDFSGYAWGENIGWISMASGYGVNTSWRAGPTDTPTDTPQPTPTMPSGVDGWERYE